MCRTEFGRILLMAGLVWGFNTTALTLRAEQVIHDDFLVNDDTTGGCGQGLAAIARDASGNFVITWQDERDGNYDIYAQRYDSSGIAVASNFKVNNDSTYLWQYSPAVAMDSTGNFVVVWEDWRRGTPDIFAQIYDSLGVAVGSNFKVNDDGRYANHVSPAVAMDKSGKFVIVWKDERNGYYPDPDIYAQRYDSKGVPLGPNFMVNNDGATAGQSSPSVAMDLSGNFVITWTDDRNGNPDIYASIYNSFGDVEKSNFKINDDTTTQWQTSPSVAIDGYSNYVITWQDGRNGNYNIYAQRYDSANETVGPNFKTNDDDGIAGQYYPVVAIDVLGDCVIAWRDDRAGNADIYAQRYNSSGANLGPNFRVNDDAGSTYQDNPAVAMGDSSDFIITWTDERHGNSNSDIYAQRYDASGGAISSNFNSNDDTGSTYQINPAIAMADSGHFVITWQDARSGNADIYTQWYSASGTAIGSNFRVNDDAGTTNQYSPAVANDVLGNFVITWGDDRNYYGPDVFAQRYDFSGAAVGPNFKVNDFSHRGYNSYPAIAMDGSGNFIIVWRDDKAPFSGDIYARRYTKAGIPLGPSYKVNDVVGRYAFHSPAVAMDYTGNIIVTWADNRYPSLDIYAQRYDSSGTAIGSNFKVNDDVVGASQGYPVIAVDSYGNFVIVWQDGRNGYPSDVYAQRYNSSGTALGSNFKVNDVAVGGNEILPMIAIDNFGNFVIIWQDYHNGNYDVYAQKFDSFGNRIDGNFMVTNPQYSSFAQLQPAITSNGPIICLAWQDNRRAKGWDIYAKVVDWSWSGCVAIPGDVNNSGTITLVDIIHLINYVFDKDRPPCLGIDSGNCWTPDPICRGDINESGDIAISDVVDLVNYVFDKDKLPCRGIDPGNCWTPPPNGACCLPLP